MAKKKPKLELVEGSTAEEHKAFAGKNFSVHNLTAFSPKGPRQEQFVKSYYEDIPMIMQLGSPGSGKSFVAIQCALADVLDKSTVYDKLVIVRSAVQGREVGFLPGGVDALSAESKFTPYEKPYKDICDQILNFKSNNYDNLKAIGKIEFESTSFLRGITWDNAIVVFDEIQNATFQELYTTITRLGVNSRIIGCGDFAQDDLNKKRNDKSGLGDLMKILNQMPASDIDVITYTTEDIVRGDFIKSFLIAAEKAGF